MDSTFSTQRIFHTECMETQAVTPQDIWYLTLRSYDLIFVLRVDPEWMFANFLVWPIVVSPTDCPIYRNVRPSLTTSVHVDGRLIKRSGLPVPVTYLYSHWPDFFLTRARPAFTFTCVGQLSRVPFRREGWSVALPAWKSPVDPPTVLSRHACNFHDANLLGSRATETARGVRILNWRNTYRYRTSASPLGRKLNWLMDAFATSAPFFPRVLVYSHSRINMTCR